MIKGEFTWKETIYRDVAFKEVPKVVAKLLLDREPSDGQPVEVEPEGDGYYTVSFRRLENAEWHDSPTERTLTQEEANHLCDTCPEAEAESQEAARELAEDILNNPDRKCTLSFSQKYLPTILAAIDNTRQIKIELEQEDVEDAE